jgi:hypothetical protein
VSGLRFEWVVNVYDCSPSVALRVCWPLSTMSMAKTWIAPSEPVANIQQGKVKAEAYAKAYLKNSVNLELPSLEWKSSRPI